jgi:riboflavin transporter FmnP
LTKNVTLNFTTLAVEFAASSLNYWLLLPFYTRTWQKQNESIFQIGFLNKRVRVMWRGVSLAFNLNQ